jgi:signal transduction histidine kinase
MTDQISGVGALRPHELEAIYAISQAVAGGGNPETTLNEIIRLVRPVFIFDNMVLYEKRGDTPFEPTFARAIGRGRFQEADLAWGEATASEVFVSSRIVTRKDEAWDDAPDRNNTRYFLGIPLNVGGEMMGALIFVRFGGPSYSADQTYLAEFIAVHVAQLLEHTVLVDRIADLEARRRLDSLQDDFIAMISHELLTPLGFIKGYATTLLREDIEWDSASRREFLQIIDEESDRLRDLIDNLMDSSRLQAGTLHMNTQPLRLDMLLKDMATRARSRDENLKINVTIRTAGMIAQADPARLAQVFENLLSNASKYAPGSPIDIILDRPDALARIAVIDHGPGIAPEHLPKLFKRFFRVPGQSISIRGTGLGLYICRQIVQAHGGEITVSSQPGQGTTFYIHIPVERQV